MKELSIEEKAKRYDEILARAKGANIPYYKEDIMSKIKEFVDYLIPELAESEDERIRKALIRFHKSTIDVDGIKGEDIIAWLEKQGENSVCKVKIGETYKCIASPRYTFFRKGDTYHVKDNFVAELINICSGCFVLLEKQSEQNHTNKVEPEFRKGDWVVLTVGELSTTLQIVNVDTNKRLYWFNDSNYLPIVDEECLHLWTIQDAKNGDVLSDGTTIFIFKDLLSDGSVMPYCDYNTDSGDSDAFCPLSVKLMCSKITPATKEQRDILFQKMHEVGYEWDAEHKQLNKIKDESAWTEGDEKMLSDIIKDLVHPWNEYIPDRIEDEIKWLKRMVRRLV